MDIDIDIDMDMDMDIDILDAAWCSHFRQQLTLDSNLL